MKKKKKCKNPKCDSQIPKGVRAYCCVNCQREAKRARDKKKKWHFKRTHITVKKLDTLFSKVARERTPQCEYCKTTKNLNTHHIYGRRNRSLRWDLDNSCILCVNHHKFSTEFSAHETPISFTNWLTTLRGREFMERLNDKARVINKQPLEYWEKKLCDK